MDVSYKQAFRLYKREGSGEGDGAIFCPDWSPADDGKRLEALDVVIQGESYLYKGGSLREGGSRFARVGG